MIPLLTPDRARALDRWAADTVGVPGRVLMENAGRGATDLLCERFPSRLRRVVVVGGTGQNGGDAWVVARHLRARGLAPRVFLLGERESVSGDAAPNLDALEVLQGPVRALDGGGLEPLEDALRGASLIVDGVFGTGLSREVEGFRRDALVRLDEAAAPVLALDVPSGVDAGNGQVLGVAPAAACTATFGGLKRGLFQHPGAGRAGEVVPVHIGVPSPSDVRDVLFDPEDARARLARRSPDAHKGVAGHVLIAGGGPGRRGAAVLAGRGALRGGAGLVTLASPGADPRAAEPRVVELMTEALPAPGDPADALRALAELAAGKGAVVLGPGFGTTADALEVQRRAAVTLECPVVLDADALTALAADPGGLDRLRGAPAPRVLTPHPGEAARLLGVGVPEVQRDRFAAATTLSERAGAVVALKGAGTIVAAPGGARRVCRRGTPALGVAGTGDVLAGVLAAQLAGGLPVLEAASVAVLLHAVAGERAARGDRGLLASEVADAVPDVLAAWLGG